MKRILNALGKTLAFLGIGVGIGLVPALFNYLLGPAAAIVVAVGGVISILFYLIYKAEK
jgi:hypothetical protein